MHESQFDEVRTFVEEEGYLIVIANGHVAAARTVTFGAKVTYGTNHLQGDGGCGAWGNSLWWGRDNKRSRRFGVVGGAAAHTVGIDGDNR